MCVLGLEITVLSQRNEKGTFSSMRQKEKLQKGNWANLEPMIQGGLVPKGGLCRPLPTALMFSRSAALQPQERPVSPLHPVRHPSSNALELTDVSPSPHSIKNNPHDKF